MGAALVALTSAANPVHAAGPVDTPLSVTLAWLETCMTTGTVSLTINGVAIGSYDVTSGQAARRPVAATTSSARWSSATRARSSWRDIKGCNLFQATFTGLTGASYLMYVKATVQYSVTGPDAYCIGDTSNGSCVYRNICSSEIAIANNRTFATTLTDANMNGTPDCRETGFDADGDGIANSLDNCPYRSNVLQTDSDSDGVGDACDNCPLKANVNQLDTDTDGIGDVCDNCPSVANPSQSDCNNNGVGDACEPLPANQDSDGDGVCNGTDNCPTVANPIRPTATTTASATSATSRRSPSPGIPRTPRCRTSSTAA